MHHPPLWQVVTVGGKLSHSSATTHRIKLRLRPELTGVPGQTRLLISDDNSTP